MNMCPDQMAHLESTILFQLFVIFIAAVALGKIFEKLRLPGVLGEVLAGVMFGPSVLAVVNPTEAISSIAELGAIFLLFAVGLEMHPEQLIRIGRKALAVACAGIVFSFGVTYAFLLFAGHGTKVACIVAAALVATSVGISARVLRDLKVLDSPSARIILGAAVCDDVLAMILLAAIVELADSQGVHWWRLGILIGESIAFALCMVFLAPRIVRRADFAVKKLSISNAPLIIALAVCLGLSVATTQIGLAAIVGAFFAGLALAEFASQWAIGPSFHNINQFLSPFFFFTMGAQLDISLLKDFRVIAVAAVITLLAIASKIVGSGLPLIREGWRTTLQVGVGMVPRGEVTLVIALIGLRMKLISPVFYAVLLFVITATTLLTPALLRLLFRTTVAPAKAAAAHV